MPSCARVVSAAVAVAALSCRYALAAYQEPTWVLSEDRKSCSETCRGLAGQSCSTNAWPVDSTHMLRVATQLGQTCNQVSRVTTGASGAPFIRLASLTDKFGDCSYPDKAATASCDAAPTTNDRRFCACTSQTVQWRLAEPRESCSTSCTRLKGKCADAELIADASVLTALADPLGYFCSSATAPTAAEGACSPSTKGATCIKPQTYPFSVNCAAVPPTPVPSPSPAATAELRRICPCYGAEAASSSASQATQAKANAGLGICHGGTFHEGQGVGGTKGAVQNAGTITSAEMCRQKVLETCPQGNGATYDSATKTCWCQQGMTSYEHTPGFKVCWFTDGRFTRGLGGDSRLTRLWARLSVDKVGTPGSVAAGATAVALLVAVLVGVALLRRRGGGGVALVSTEDDEMAAIQ